MFWAHHPNQVEVSGMGLCSKELLTAGKIECQDIIMLKQKCTECSTDIDDLSMNEYFNRQFDMEKEIGEFGCVWLHTHPSNCNQPSEKDETTFDKTFARHPWALMLILGKDGSMYGRLKSNFPRIQQKVTVVVDWTQWEGEVRPREWLEQYEALVTQPNQVELCGKTDSDAPSARVDYADFSEYQTGMGSYSAYLGWMEQAERTMKNDSRWEKTFLDRRRKLIKQMERGTMYESEVQLLLWFNWWLQQEKWPHAYPSNWKLFTQQEGVTIKFKEDGPVMTRIPYNDETRGIQKMGDQTSFGEGLPDDIPGVGYPAL